jgi:hypothetical protein
MMKKGREREERTAIYFQTVENINFFEKILAFSIENTANAYLCRAYIFCFSREKKPKKTRS